MEIITQPYRHGACAADGNRARAYPGMHRPRPCRDGARANHAWSLDLPRCPEFVAGRPRAWAWHGADHAAYAVRKRD
jgi:hypothetical protein